VALTLVRYADRPDLRARRFAELSGATFPEYMHNNEPGNRYWGRLYSDFPEFQVALLEGDELLAEAHAVPCPGTAPSTACPRAGRRASCEA
jgi:hypothetical protein